MEQLPFSLRQLQYLIAVDEHRSFSRAAEACHVSQPSLSTQVAQIEDALGVQLFERDRRRVLRTRAAEAVLPQVSRVLLAADELVVAADASRDPFDRTWRLGVIATIAPYLLPRISSKLRKKHPHLDILWTEGLTQNLVAGIEGGQLDGAIVALEADLGDLEREAIVKDEFVLAVGPDHPLAKGKRRVRSDVLADEPLLLLDDGHCLRDQAIAFCSTTKTTELGFRATSLPTLTEMVASGLGVTLLPELALPMELRGRRLGVRRFAAPAPHRTIGLVWRKGYALSEVFRDFADTIGGLVARPQ